MTRGLKVTLAGSALTLPFLIVFLPVPLVFVVAIITGLSWGLIGAGIDRG